VARSGPGSHHRGASRSDRPVPCRGRPVGPAPAGPGMDGGMAGGRVGGPVRPQRPLGAGSGPGRRSWGPGRVGPGPPAVPVPSVGGDDGRLVVHAHPGCRGLRSAPILAAVRVGQSGGQRHRRRGLHLPGRRPGQRPPHGGVGRGSGLLARLLGLGPQPACRPALHHRGGRQRGRRDLLLSAPGLRLGRSDVRAPLRYTTGQRRRRRSWWVRSAGD